MANMMKGLNKVNHNHDITHSEPSSITPEEGLRHRPPNQEPVSHLHYPIKPTQAYDIDLPTRSLCHLHHPLSKDFNLQKDNCPPQ
ncbi:hypothetical protein INR49_019283, partial [Caranx melampygus]